MSRLRRRHFSHLMRYAPQPAEAEGHFSFWVTGRSVMDCPSPPCSPFRVYIIAEAKLLRLSRVVKLHRLTPARHPKAVLLPHTALHSGDTAAGPVGWQKPRPGARAFPLRGGPCQPLGILGETENVRAGEASRIHGRSVLVHRSPQAVLCVGRVSFRAVLLTLGTSASFTSLPDWRSLALLGGRITIIKNAADLRLRHAHTAAHAMHRNSTRPNPGPNRLFADAQLFRNFWHFVKPVHVYPPISQ